MLRMLLIGLALLVASTAHARCTGTDLRELLTPSGAQRLERELKSVPFANGNHWIATKGNRKIHVIGTQHTGDSRMRGIIRTLRPFIEQADVVLLEVSTRELKRLDDVLRQDPSIVMIPPGPGLPELMDAEDWSMLSLRMKDQGIDTRVLARMQPWFVSMNLSGSGCGGRGLFSHSGLDDRIERIAIRNRIPVGSLETVGDGMRALSGQPMRDQLRMLELDLKSQLNVDDQVVTLANAYFEEDLAAAMLIQRWTLYSDLNIPRREVERLLIQYENRILEDRNYRWMPIIQRTKAETLFVAVGAAHLPGRTGLLRLLEKQGYSLTRAPF